MGEELAEDIFPHLPTMGALPSDIVLFNFGALPTAQALPIGSVKVTKVLASTTGSIHPGLLSI